MTALVCVGPPWPAAAQTNVVTWQMTPPTNQVTWRLRPTASFREENQTEFTVFTPIDAIELEFMIRNPPQSLGAVSLESAIVKSMTLTLTGGASLDQPVAAEVVWTVPLNCRPGASCPADARVVLQRNESARAIVTLRPVSGTLQAGRYRLVADFSAARERLQTDAGARWEGQFSERNTYTFALQEPQTGAERWLALQLAARRALARQDYEGALQYFKRMAAVDPDEPEVHEGLGQSLLRLGRYSEAATELRQALPEPQEPSAVPEQLALAYVAMGEDARAEAMLRDFYPRAEIPRILAAVRERARTLPDPAR